MMSCINMYYSWSGQKANKEKSFVHFSKNYSGRDAIEVNEILRMNQLKHNDKHLGLQIFASMRKLQDFNYLVERVQSRIQGWKKEVLSKAGRLDLIKSVVTSSPTYSMMSLPLPKKTCKDIDGAFRDFSWGKFKENNK